MIATIAATAVLAQAPVGFSDTTRIAYPGLPDLQAPIEVRMDQHSVSMRVRNGRVLVETVSTFKNETDQALEDVSLVIPSYNVNMPGERGKDWKVLWSDEPIFAGSLASSVQAINTPDESIELTAGSTTATFSVDIKPGHTHSLKTSMNYPLGGGINDDLDRYVAYGFGAADRPAISEINLSIQYSKDEVFQVITTTPRYLGWEYDDTGAFFEMRNWRPPSDGVNAVFHYYRGGFNDIVDRDN